MVWILNTLETQIPIYLLCTLGANQTERNWKDLHQVTPERMNLIVSLYTCHLCSKLTKLN